MIIWLNGILTEEATARIDPRDRGFLLGDGLFETILVRHGRPRLLTAHIERLARGAEQLGFPPPPSAPHLAAVCAQVLEANGLSRRPQASLRITLTRGPGPRGLSPPEDPHPTLLVSAANAAPHPTALSAIIATVRRNEHAPTAHLKTLAYLDNVLAKREAHAAGANEALLLNSAGHLACASAANLFMIENTSLITPPLADGALNGTVRGLLLGLAPRLGIDTREESITPERLSRAAAAFVTNSLIGLCPLTRIGTTALPEHKLTSRLAAAYDMKLDEEE